MTRIKPGKYDDLCAYVRAQADAEVVVIVVLGGKDGTGYGMCSTRDDELWALPDVLRATAADIEESASKQREGGGDGQE